MRPRLAWLILVGSCAKMTTMLLAHLFVAAIPADQVAERFFESMLTAHRRRTSATVVASQKIVDKGTLATRFEVAYRRPSAARIVLEGSQKRTVWASSGGVVLFDWASMRYAKKPWNPALSLSKNLQAAGTGLDDLLIGLVDPEVLSATLKGVRPLKWTIQGSTASANGPNGKVVVTKASSGELGSFEAKSGGKAIKWTFRYGPGPSSLAIALPKDAVEIHESAVAEKGPPAYADAAARKYTERAFDAYDLLNRVEYSVRDSKGASHVWYDGDYVRESNSRYDFVYRPGKFMVIDRVRKRGYSGDVRFAKAQEVMDRAGLGWDSLMRELLRGRNPLRAMLSPSFRANSAGSMLVDGAKCSLIRYVGPRLRVMFLIRQRDGLVLRTTSESVDGSGQVVSSTDRTYKYLSYRRPISKSAFQVTVPSGYPKLDLARLTPSE